jgi:hypothetical protein
VAWKKAPARKKPAAKRASRRNASPPRAGDVTGAHDAFDSGATQQVPSSEVVGDIEESMALAKLTD